MVGPGIAEIGLVRNNPMNVRARPAVGAVVAIKAGRGAACPGGSGNSVRSGQAQGGIDVQGHEVISNMGGMRECLGSKGEVVGGRECCCDGEEQDQTGVALDHCLLASAGGGGENLGKAVNRGAEPGMPDRVGWGKDHDPVGPGADCGEDVSAPLPPPRKNSQPMTVLPPPARSMAAQVGLAVMPRVMKDVPSILSSGPEIWADAGSYA